MGFLPTKKGVRRFFFDRVDLSDFFRIETRKVLVFRDSVRLGDSPSRAEPQAFVVKEPFTAGTVLVVGRTTAVTVHDVVGVGTVPAFAKTSRLSAVVTVPAWDYLTYKNLSTHVRDRALVLDSFFRIKGAGRILATAPAFISDLFTASTRPLVIFSDGIHAYPALQIVKLPSLLVKDMVNIADNTTYSKSASPLLFTLFSYRPKIRYLQLSVVDKTAISDSFTTSKTLSPLLFTLFGYRPRVRYLQLSVADSVNVFDSVVTVKTVSVVASVLVLVSDKSTPVRAPATYVADRVSVLDLVPSGSVSYISAYGLQKLVVLAADRAVIRDYASAISAKVVSAKDVVRIVDSFVLPKKTVLVVDRAGIKDSSSASKT